VEPVDGYVAITKTCIYVYEDDNLKRKYDAHSVTEYKFTPGVGCVFAECTIDGHDVLLCRASMDKKDEIAAIMSRLNKMLEAGKFSYDYEAEIDKKCPKCGRPFPPGSHVCPHCVKKIGYLVRLWDIARPYKYYIFASVAFYFVIAALNLVPPRLNRILVDNYIKATTRPFLSGFISVIVSIFLVNLLTRVLNIFRSLILIKASNRMIVALRGMVFNRIQMLSVSRISKRTAGELINRVNNDSSRIQSFFTNELGGMIEQLLILIAVSVILFVYNWRLALFILLPTPVVMIFYRLFRRIMHRMYDVQWRVGSQANTILHDIFSGIRVVKAFGMEHREMARYDEATRNERDIRIRNETFYACFNPFVSFLLGFGEFALLYYVGNKVVGGTMTLGEMSQFSAYVSIIYGPLLWLSNFPRRLVWTMTSIVKVFDIIDEDIDVKDAPDAKDIEIKGEVELEGVSFGYDNTANVLRNINLKIKPGEFIGLVGRSGVGKSTLINLIMRLYDPDEGVIRIDGIDEKEISQKSLRSQIGVVLQETFLFAGTVYDNIAYAKPSATRDEVITASKLAGAHQFIMKMPDAYNTRVGERGHTLSGGERQRIAIARALLHNPRILILDEATSALDTETEKQIQDALRILSKDRTTIAIAHRLSTLRNATRLVVLDKGTIAEVGTHDELIQKKGIYYNLVMAQRQMSKMK
jgi:ATP-binding cassette subfamily B protein